MNSKRHYLFLQGPTSHFFTMLAKELRKQGHEVDKINFNCGDSYYWAGQRAHHFRDDVDKLNAYLNRLFMQHNYTDVLALGDTRPVHCPIKKIAAKYNARLQVVEEGYLRPHWLTLELHGINGHSQLPSDPQWYTAAAKLIPDYKNGEVVSNATWLLAFHEICYHLPNLLNPFFYRGYKTHRPVISGLEIAGWASRFARLPSWEKKDKSKIRRLLDAGQRYYLLPLQLDSDAQIVNHSPFNNMSEIIDKVLASFSQYAPADAVLVIKNHPLDTGFVNFKQLIQRLEKKYGLAGRTLYLQSGHLPSLLDASKGVITVNSTVGTSALVHNCPTIALGKAIYDMPGLTFQAGLDQFWKNGQAPDKKLFRDFRNVVIHATQINGGFYSFKGVKLGVANCARVMTQAQSQLQLLEAQVAHQALLAETELADTESTVTELRAEPAKVQISRIHSA